MLIRFIIYAILSFNTIAASNIIIKNYDNKIVNFPLSSYVDKNMSENIHTIKNKKFNKILKNPFSIAYCEGTTWLHFSLENRSNKSYVYIYFTEAYFQTVNLYEHIEKNITLHKNGISSHLSSNEIKNKNPLFKIDLKEGEIKDIYIQINAKLPKFGAVEIYTNKELLNQEKSLINNQYMFYFGGLFIIIVFNIFLLFKLKEAIYGYYVGYTFSYLIFIASLTSYTIEVGLKNWYYQFYAITPLVMAFLLLFTNEILNVKKYSSKLTQLFYFFVFICLILVVLILIDISKWYFLITIVSTIIFAILFLTSLYIWREGDSDAKLYFIALSIYLITMVLFTAMANGWIENNTISRYLFLYSSFFEIIFFSLMLANRFDKINTEKLKIQESLISLKSKNEEILENEVKNRTAELINTKEELIKLNNTLELRVKESISKIREKEKILKEQSKLAQMGEMISMIAHQWRQPLGAISSAVFGIQTKIATNKYDLNKSKDQEEFMRFLEKKHISINDYVQFLSTTIDDFRNFFKPDKSKEHIDITLPITRALHIVQTSLENKGITITFEFETNQILPLYQNEMMQVILNIIKNSEDNFNERNILNPQINIITREEDDFYVISICDNGKGIDDEILPKIFEPYFSTKDTKNGTGLGLYMSKIIIEEHNNGTLKVINTPTGVCFDIIFYKNNYFATL